MKHKFIDEVRVYVRSGNGGPGCVSFRREKFVPKGGPDGGDGGRGGDVVIRADGQKHTLLDFKYRPRHLARNGGGGEGRQRTGADGRQAIMLVPVGTIVSDLDTGERLADLANDGDEIIPCIGGRGGKGNEHFKNARQQAPRYAQPGEEGIERNLRLELKLLADVGLVGMPSVGKSSLIARISAARPKIADYPFTTLAPNLGVVRAGGDCDFVVADVPGLIVGAHQGAGLGTRFLRHIERVKFIAHLVTVEMQLESTEEDDSDAITRDPIDDFEAIENEMLQHNADLAAVPRVLLLNRIDLPFVATHKERVQAFAKAKAIPFFAISAITGEGVDAFLNYLAERFQHARDDHNT